MRDILKGLEYLHFRPSTLIHRNISMQNVVFGEDNNYKICNFGHVTTHKVILKEECALLDNEIKRHTKEGYRAPE